MTIEHYPAGFWGENGVVYSFDDLNKARKYFYPLMVPPAGIPHAKILMLGICLNNAGNLILEKYPDARLTLVDNEPIIPGVIKADAPKWVNACTDHFDVAIIDLARDGDFVDFIYEASFYAGLRRVCSYAIVNTEDFKTAVYGDSFDLVSSALSHGSRILLLRSK